MGIWQPASVSNGGISQAASFRSADLAGREMGVLEMTISHCECWKSGFRRPRALGMAISQAASVGIWDFEDWELATLLSAKG